MLCFVKSTAAFLLFFISFFVCTLYGENCFSSSKCKLGDVTITGEFLFWQPEISGISYAATNTLTPTPLGYSLANNIEFHSVEFDYKPGFRVSALYTIPCSSWDIDLDWTSFKTSRSDSIAASGDRIISTFWDPLGVISANTASSRVNINLQNVDLNLGKNIEFYGCFSFRPFVGAGYYKLYVDNHIEYIGTIPTLSVAASSKDKLFDHSEGFGLNIGSKGLWKLPCGFGIYGSGSYSVYRSKSNNKISQTVMTPAIPSNLHFKTKSNGYVLNQIFKVACGIRWYYEGCIKSCPFNLSLFAGYEFNYLPDQIELKRAQFGGTNTAVIPLSFSGDVGFHGLSTGLSLTY